MHDGRIPDSLIASFRRDGRGTYRVRHLHVEDLLVAALGAAGGVGLLLVVAWVVELVGS